MTLSVSQASRGHEDATERPVALSAGDLRADLVGPDLRSVRWGGCEVAERVYMAVRDAPWNTVPGDMLEREVVQGSGHFKVTFRQRHRFEDIDLEWAGRIRGSADGELVYEMDALAARGSRYSKIGLNIHHGLAEYRGRRYRAATNSGETSGRLPTYIAPQLVIDGKLTAMFDHFDQIAFDLDGVRAVFAFEGDRFEMQDHRNWADANYKTYSTPLAFGFPHDIEAGERLWQRMTLHVTGNPPPLPRRGAVELTPQVSPTRLPMIGHRLADDSDPAAATLAHARPDYLRVEVATGEDIASRLAAVRNFTLATPTPIELVVAFDPSDWRVSVASLAGALEGSSTDVLGVVVLASCRGFSNFKEATPAGLVQATQAALRARGIAVPVFSGTDQFFNEVNRTPQRYTDVDGIAFGLSPQVHACDDRSLMNNVMAVPDIAASCRRLYPGAQISIGPIHLVSPDGPFPAGPSPLDGTPPELDARHMSLFGAAWTVAFLEAAVRAAIDRVTLYDLVGPRGLAATSKAEARVARYPSVPGHAFPMLWVLGQLRTYTAGVPVLASGGDGRCAVVGVRGSSAVRLLIANLREEITDVRVTLGAGPAEVRMLDELTVGGVDVLADELPVCTLVPLIGGYLSVLLRPYAVACVEVPLAQPS